jgi:cation-transporting P-type ATPase D
LAPDGFHLCNCDEKKINWYLKKELADVVQQNPPYWVIRLKFLPGGKSMEQLRSEINQFEHGFYMEERANRCCVCGTPKHYLKYHIIPLLYRRHFPQTYKSHRSHDVVLVCPDCHQRANMASDQLKTQIAR